MASTELRRRDDQLVFGSTDSSPFVPQSLQRRADTVWKAAKVKRTTLHECRHSFASLMIAAGVNAKRAGDHHTYSERRHSRSRPSLTTWLKRKLWRGPLSRTLVPHPAVLALRCAWRGIRREGHFLPHL